MSGADEYVPSVLNFATGAGGVLYPAGCFHHDINDIALFEKYAPKADDIWFKAMTLLKDVKYVKMPEESPFENRFILLNNMQDIALHHTNVGQNANDVQIKAVFDAYNLFEKLKNCE